MNGGNTITEQLGLIRRIRYNQQGWHRTLARIGSFDEPALLGVVGRIPKPV